MVGALRNPFYCTTRSKVIVRTGKCQPEAKHQNKESNGKAKLKR